MNAFDAFGHSDLASPEPAGHGLFDQFHQAAPQSGGTPTDDAKDWIHQTTDFTCAVVSQEMILHEFGVDASEAQLVHEADAHGWLSDGGTSAEDLGKLLELNGVSCHTNMHASAADLENELMHGHKVIVGVFADGLWQQNPVETGIRELLGLDEANHALVLTGVDMSDPQHPRVYVNDPGDPNGGGKAYPLDQFLEAWHGSENMYVATDSAPPHLADHSLFGAHYSPALGAYKDWVIWDPSSGHRTYVTSTGPTLSESATQSPPLASAEGLF
ncbi:MAG TPA: C39 family peptidase [Candidatus Baltobacteraceae bacterium]|jgi:hypothetical protein|nr:C39 family peptidase [Candidatus Baltobacteraceae bacterium]